MFSDTIHFSIDPTRVFTITSPVSISCNTTFISENSQKFIHLIFCPYYVTISPNKQEGTLDVKYLSSINQIRITYICWRDTSGVSLYVFNLERFIFEIKKVSVHINTERQKYTPCKL